MGVHLRDSRYLVCLPEKAESLPSEGQEAVLLIDEGIYYFELRAIYIRGQLEHVEPPEMQSDRIWFELKPCKTVAWDYGTLHEVNDEP